MIGAKINFNNLLEYTTECNPINVNDNFIEYLKKMNVNRVSLGIQSFNDKILKFCNRKKQNYEIIVKSLNLLNSNFDNISIDLINGLPDLNIDLEINRLNDILNKFKNIVHISIYDLSVEKGCYFYDNKINLSDNSLIKSKYEKEIKKLLRSHCFKQYEISNYCKNNKKSIHNLNYWKYKNYIGLGPLAHSTIGNLRIENSILKNKDVNYKNQYLLSKKEQIEEYVLMGLRLKEGFLISDFNFRFNIDFKNMFIKWININKDMIKINKNRVKTTKKGFMFLNKPLVDFFEYIDNIQI